MRRCSEPFAEATGSSRSPTTVGRSTSTSMRGLGRFAATTSTCTAVSGGSSRQAEPPPTERHRGMIYETIRRCRPRGPGASRREPGPGDDLDLGRSDDLAVAGDQDGSDGALVGAPTCHSRRLLGEMLVTPRHQGEQRDRTQASPRPPFSVARTDNVPRVRDGYTSRSTPGHARTLAAHRQRPICRTNVTANDRACTRVPPLDFHGKEGVDGSSPSEGFTKCLQIGIYCRPPRKHADTFRTHLRYARRTAKSRDAA